MIWINLSKANKNVGEETAYKKHSVPFVSWLYSGANKKTVGGVQSIIMSPFKTNTTKNYSKPSRVKKLYGGRKKSRKLEI